MLVIVAFSQRQMRAQASDVCNPAQLGNSMLLGRYAIRRWVQVSVFGQT